MNAMVDRLAVRWVLAAPAAGHDADVLLDRFVHGALADALDDLLIDSAELIAIRSVVVPPVRFSYADGRALGDDRAGEWAAQVVRAIRATLRAGPPHVVRYPNPHAALVDLVRAVAAGDMSRAWAWRRLELWPRTTAVGPAAGTAAPHRTPSWLIAQALTAHPDAIVPVVVAVARAGGLPALLGMLDGRRLGALADAAWAVLGRARPHAGAGVVRPAVPVNEVVTPAADEVQAPAGTIIPDATRADDAEDRPGAAAAAGIVARSVLARAALDAGVDLGTRGPDTVTAFAALVVAEAEPALVSAGPSISVEVITRSVVSRLSDQGADGGVVRHEPAASAGPVISAAAMGHPAPPAGGEADWTAERGPAPGQVNEATSGASETPATSALAPRPALQAVRRRSRTGNGGLFFLLHLLDSPWLFGPPRGNLARAGGRWTLYRLGAALVRRSAPRLGEPDPADPALLGFCGLPPQAAPPEPLRAIDLRAAGPAIDELADQVERLLRDRLAGRPAARLDRAGLLALVIHRRAEVAADPGWLDVHLDLAEVTVDLRAAGLDLDLGHVPWLGCVVRFRYE